MFRCIIIFFLLSHTIAFSQDWALFPYGQKSMYLKQDTAHTFEVLVADSLQGETYYFNRKVDLPIDQDCINNVYAYYYNGPYITVNDLDSIIETTDTTFFYCSYTDVPFIFLKHANPGDSWIIDSDVSSNVISAIEITCIEIGEEMVFATMDSIKKFQLNVPDDPDSPINSYIITLSKNFGFIEFILPIDYLYNPSSIEILPYNLIGFIKDSDTVGYNLPEWSEYFNLQPGDKLQWKNSHVVYTIPTISYYEDSIIEVIRSVDSIKYIYNRKVLDFDTGVYQQFGLSTIFSKRKYEWMTVSPTNWFSLSNVSIYSYFTNQSIWLNNTNYVQISDDLNINNVVRFYHTYGAGFEPIIPCYVYEATDSYYSTTLNSFSGVTSFFSAFIWESMANQLIGFQIGDSIWGAQELPTTIFNISVESEINLYPNPASNNISLQISITHPWQYAIYNIQGQLIINGMLTENTISVSELTSGMYILEVRDNESVYRGKFIKE